MRCSEIVFGDRDIFCSSSGRSWWSSKSIDLSWITDIFFSLEHIHNPWFKIFIMRNRNHILKIFYGLDIFKAIFPPKYRMFTFSNQRKNYLLLVFIWWGMKIGFYYKKCLDKLIYHTSGTTQRIDHTSQLKRLKIA